MKRLFLEKGYSFFTWYFSNFGFWIHWVPRICNLTFLVEICFWNHFNIYQRGLTWWTPWTFPKVWLCIVMKVPRWKIQSEINVRLILKWDITFITKYFNMIELNFNRFDNNGQRSLKFSWAPFVHQLRREITSSKFTWS